MKKLPVEITSFFKPKLMTVTKVAVGAIGFVWVFLAGSGSILFFGFGGIFPKGCAYFFKGIRTSISFMG